MHEQIRAIFFVWKSFPSISYIYILQYHKKLNPSFHYVNIVFIYYLFIPTVTI